MKNIYILLALAAFVAPVISEAATSGKKCAFGDSSGDLKDELDSTARGKRWYQMDHISISSSQRLQGLTQSEKEMVQLATGGGGPLEQDLKDFASSEGYITYFSHNSNRREFAMVASYPGDNEFGLILEIKRGQRGDRNDVRILGVAAVISDGDLEACKVFN